MILLLLACAAPVIASYLAYYVFKPEGGKTNYGTLIQPPQAINPSWLDISFSGRDSVDRSQWRKDDGVPR